MPKMKTNKSVSKRFRKTATGKYKISKPKRRHLMTGKTAKQKRGYRDTPVIHKTDSRRLRVLMPYA